MKDPEMIVHFEKEGKRTAFCAGAHGHWKHDVKPVSLELRPSGVVRRGVCNACGRIFVSLIPKEEAAS